MSLTVSDECSVLNPYESHYLFSLGTMKMMIYQIQGGGENVGLSLGWPPTRVYGFVLILKNISKRCLPPTTYLKSQDNTILLTC